MKKILSFGASNSKKSINKTLAIYAANQIKDVDIIIADLNDFELPIYNFDLENESGIPQKAQDFKELIDQADGIIISLAEHNGMPTTVFKNLFDWISRIDAKAWNEKSMLLLATSPGARGAQSVLGIMKGVFTRFGAQITDDFSLPTFYDNFSEEGIKNEELKKELEQKINTFETSIKL